MQDFSVADYFRDQSKVLFKQVKSDVPGVRKGALMRLRMHRPSFEMLPDEAVQSSVRLGDCHEVIARELKYEGGWRELVRDLEGRDGGFELHDVPDDGKLKRILVSLGNSTRGTIGASVWVLAYTAEEALEIVQESLPYESSVQPLYHDDEVDYIEVYFNPKALSLADIEDWEHWEDENEEQ